MFGCHRSRDNRTAPFRILGSGKSLRIECRLPGADCNVYLAFAAALASGLDGIRNKIEPPPALEGNIYFAKDLLSVPQSLVRFMHFLTYQGMRVLIQVLFLIGHLYVIGVRSGEDQRTNTIKTHAQKIELRVLNLLTISPP